MKQGQLLITPGGLFVMSIGDGARSQGLARRGIAGFLLLAALPLGSISSFLIRIKVVFLGEETLIGAGGEEEGFGLEGHGDAFVRGVHEVDVAAAGAADSD